MMQVKVFETRMTNLLVLILCQRLMKNKTIVNRNRRQVVSFWQDQNTVQ